MNTQLILDYLAGLASHNEREWYHAHKAEYKEANAEFESLLQELILRIGEFDNSVLYNPAFRAHISAKGKLPVPVGYYLMIKPGGQSFLGGGLFADMFKEATAMVRDYIAANGREWEEILGDPDFRKHFTVQGTALKRVPAGYEKEHPQAEFLKYKSWYLEYPVTDAQFGDGEAFLEHAVSVFRLMKPFNDYLNRGLVNFKMPER